MDKGGRVITRESNESSGPKVDGDHDQQTDDVYDPFAARIIKQPNSDLVVFMHLLKASIGSGILFLPHAFRRAGYATALVSSMVIGLISCYTAVLTIIENFVDTSINTRIYIIMFLPIYCVLALMPNFKYLMPFSILGTIFLVLGFIITLYYFFDDFKLPGRLEIFTNITSVPIFSSIFLFAVHNMTMIMPLENSMKNPKNMPRLLTLSMMLNMFIYMAFGFFGYNKYQDACDTVIKNLPFNQVASNLVKIAVTLSVICTYGLHYYVPVTILWPMIIKKSEAIIGNHAKMYKILFKLGGVTVSTFLAAAIPQMVPVLGLLTAFSMTTTMLLMPIVIEIMTKWYDKTPLIYLFLRWTKNFIIIILWLLMFIFGAVENLRDIIKTFNEETKNDLC